MLDAVSKIVAMLGVISTVVLGWLYFVYDPPIGFSEAVDAIAANPDEATETPEAARDTLNRLGEATQALADTAAEKGFTDLPPIRITDDPIWVARHGSANWQVPGVGQVSIGVNGFNGGRAWVRYGDAVEYAYSGTTYEIAGSPCTITLEEVDEPALRAGFRMTCP